jgi:hypothetical protein
MPLGWALSDSGCVMLSGCSMIGSDGINYSTSFFQSSYQCNGACIQDTTVVLECIDSALIDLNVQCPAIYEPVCGCDSITYSNSCAAMYHAGVVSYTPGTCESASIDGLWKTEISVRPNPFTDKFTLVNEANVPISIRIFQANGLFLFETQSEQAILELEGVDLAPGTYFVQITNGQNGQKVVKRLLKQ